MLIGSSVFTAEMLLEIKESFTNLLEQSAYNVTKCIHITQRKKAAAWLN